MLKKLIKIKKKNKRIGRGYAKLGGHTTIRGQKGQRSRGKGKVKPFNQGGNIPLHRKLPKYPGFKPIKKYIAIRLKILDQYFADGAVVDAQSIAKIGYKPKSKVVYKIVGNYKIKKKLIVKNLPISEGAKSIIEKAGGKVLSD